MLKEKTQAQPSTAQKPSAAEKKKLNPESLHRNKPREETKKPPEPPGVSQGPVDKVVEYAFNPTQEKIREVTVIDRIQGRLLPQLDVMNQTWQHFIEIATYRQDADLYFTLYGKEKPEPPNLMETFTYRTAQWQKSIGGKNMQSAVDIALAETEAKGGELEEPVSGHGFED